MDQIKTRKKLSVDKIAIIWWIIGTLLLACFYFPFFGAEADYIYKMLLTFSGSAAILALVTFETKIQVALPLLFISELSAIGAGLKETNVINLNTEFLLSIIGIFTSIYITVSILKKKNTKITLENYIKETIRPYNIPNTAKLILLIMIVTTIFSMANTLRMVQPDATLVSIIYILMPTFIMLLSVVPIKETVYLRAFYYILWITFVRMGTDIELLSIVSMIEPVVYMVTLFIGRIYMLGNTDESELNSGFLKNIKKN